MANQIERIVERFGLRPHPEGGYFCEVYKSNQRVRHPGIPEGVDCGRSSGTLIYYLLVGDQFSAFHRVKWTDEIWHLYAGGPVELHVIDDDERYQRHLLSTDLASEGRPTAIVGAGFWQAARLSPGTDWAFVGCTVAPGFEFDDFEMPSRSALIQAHPQHEQIIGELTRTQR